MNKDIKEIEIDEMWHFIGSKKRGIFKAVDRNTKRTISWVVGDRNIATFRRLFKKLKHLTFCTFYTDGWDGFKGVLPKNRHIIGKNHTITIEKNNSNTRHYLGRMTRRTKIVSKTVEMVNLSIKLWNALFTRLSVYSILMIIFF